LIDKLNEQVKQLEDQMALVTAQLEAQQQETKIAAQTLTEAATAMEVVSTPKAALITVSFANSTICLSVFSPLNCRRRKRCKSGKLHW
jgi:hypothetical protein